MESTDSSSATHHHPNLPPGFRFHPTDEELVIHYLKKKAASLPLPVTIIADVDLYKFDPWELPGKATFGEQEWYFFSPRDRKYPNGARPNRAATSGYWKATGTDKPILSSTGAGKVGVKKALVFYGGKPPKGIKTNWIMHEYRLVNNNYGGNSCTLLKPPVSNSGSKKSSLRLDDWVLCRIYKKNTNLQNRPVDQRDYEHINHHHQDSNSIEAMLASTTATVKPAGSYASLLEGEENFFDGMLTAAAATSGSAAAGVSFGMNNSSKRRIVINDYWNSINGETMSSSGGNKRFHGDLNTSGGGGGGGGMEDSGGAANSFVSLMNQSNTAAFQGGGIMGSLGDEDGVVLRQQFQFGS